MIEAFADRRLDLYPDPDLKRDINRLRVEERSYGFRLVSPRDEHGHGDLGSAFSFAMLAASEIAGQRAVRVGALRHDEDDGKTPIERALDRFEQRTEGYEAERALLETPDWEWKQFMRRAGRC